MIITEAIESLERLEAQRSDLRISLDRSLALQKLWPEAFEGGGSATSQWVVCGGGPRGFSRRKLEAWDEFALMRVTRTDGKKRTFKPSQVPAILLLPEITYAREGLA